MRRRDGNTWNGFAVISVSANATKRSASGCSRICAPRRRRCRAVSPCTRRPAAGCWSNGSCAPARRRCVRRSAPPKEAALQQVYTQLGDALNDKQQQVLDELLRVPPVADASTGPMTTPRSRLEQFKLLPRRESPAAVAALTTR